jgi:acetoin utilization deacetylase AcuC-like enzyme
VRAHPWCLQHRPPAGHPETPARVQEVLEVLSGQGRGRWSLDQESLLPPEDDIVGVLAWIHDRAYIERVRDAAEGAEGWLDSHDCVVSAGTYRAAVAAAGLALQAALDLVNGRITRAFLAVRPPSHHAERDRARGYCFFNSVAAAAEVIVRSFNEPVLIVDFDAFHGNGTQRHFYERADVGYLSVHRYPCFPGSGAADEIGEGAGLGRTRNIPLAAGADDAVFCTALENGLEELGSRMRPAAIVVSAGFNAYRGDPLGGMRLTEGGFRRMTAAVAEASETWSEGRVLSLLEGGYDPSGSARCAAAHVEELTAQDRATRIDGKLLN